MSAADNSYFEIMNKDLLTRTKALVEALEDDDELAAEVTNAALGEPGGDGGEPGAEGALPPPPSDELGGELPPDVGAGGPGAEGAPEDEALGLLRDIAGGIDRLANELAPIESPEGGEFGEKPPGEEDEGDDDDEVNDNTDTEPGVPPVEDDDEFNETMPVASGA